MYTLVVSSIESRCSRGTAVVSSPILRIHDLAQQVDSPEAGCTRVPLGGNHLAGPGDR